MMVLSGWWNRYLGTDNCMQIMYLCAFEIILPWLRSSYMCKLVLLKIPSLHSLKGLVTVLRHTVRSWDSGLIVHALEAAINLLSIFFFFFFWHFWK